MTTFDPAAARYLAQASPVPEAPPVMIYELFPRLTRGMLFFLMSELGCVITDI